MSAPLAISQTQVVAAVIAGTAILLLVVPASRQWLKNTSMQIGGWIDAHLLAKHHRELAVAAVSRKLSGIKLRTEARLLRWLQQRRRRFAWLGAGYNKCLTEWESAFQVLAEEEEAAHSTDASSQPETPQFLPLGPMTYRLVQCAIGTGEGVLTYLAFQLWHFPPILLLAVVAFSGLLGAVLGHLCGQAIYRRQLYHAVAIGLIALLYCTLLGSMRFAWLLTDSDSGGGSVANLVGAFGWPIVCMLVSIVVGSQLRYLTPLEQARLDEASAKQRCDRVNQRGIALAKALGDQMRAKQAETAALVDAYYRGFSFGWGQEPLTFPDWRIIVPDEVGSLWPPPVARKAHDFAQHAVSAHNDTAAGHHALR
jgi:hypothetical protein